MQLMNLVSEFLLLIDFSRSVYNLSESMTVWMDVCPHKAQKYESTRTVNTVSALTKHVVHAFLHALLFILTLFLLSSIVVLFFTLSICPVKHNKQISSSYCCRLWSEVTKYCSAHVEHICILIHSCSITRSMYASRVCICVHLRASGNHALA